LNALTNLFEMETITSALIFARTRIETTRLASELSQRGFPAEALNGDLEQNARERILGRFRTNTLKVLVATDVAARGLDIDDISHVINFQLPDDPEVYVHRIGRTGRMGKAGIAMSFFTPREKRRLRDIEGFTKQTLTLAKLPTQDDIFKHREEQLLEQMKVWLARGRSKRERAMVEQLAAEGHDPLDIAAAALKLSRAGEKQRPVAAIAEVVETRYASQPRERTFGRDRSQVRGRRDASGRNVSSRDSSSGKVSHEAGMIRMKMNTGKYHGVRPNDVVGMIAYHADIPGNTIGKIRIEDMSTLVDIPEQFVEKVLAKNGDYRIGKHKFALERA
jgi:ATP-dependent RNA helicase DeaD